MSIYLDFNATGPPRPEVLAAALPFITEHWGNPASAHAAARRPAAALEAAREQVAAWAGAPPAGVIFTSGATEANQLALRGVGRRLLASAVEHPSVRAGVLAAGGALLPVDGRGVLDPGALPGDLEGVLVSVMAANNETGVLQPIGEIHRRVRAAGGLLHVDAAQLGGRLPAPDGWDLLTVSGHKAGGLKGGGALVLRPGVEVTPQLLGGSQERGRRGGTVDVPAAVALGCALSLPPPPGLAALRDALEAAAAALGAAVSGAGAARLPNTLHLTFADLPGEAVVAGLDLEGVCASTGAACASGAAEPSYVLEAMGLDPRAGVRLSLGWSTTGEQVDAAARALARVVERHRAVARELDWSV